MSIQPLLLVQLFYFMGWVKMIKNLEINIATGQVNEIVMSENDIEMLIEFDSQALANKAQEEADSKAALLAAEEQARLDAEAKAAAKAAVLAKLGLTEEDINIFLQ